MDIVAKALEGDRGMRPYANIQKALMPEIEGRLEFPRR